MEDADETVQVVERILEALRDPFGIEGQWLFIGASAGVVLTASAGGKPEELLRDADLAMYRAKSKGTSRFEVVDPILSCQAGKRLELKRDLARAFEREEFIILYQPKVQLATGKIAGMEALLRWNHQRYGPIPPSDFVPLAEKTGLMVEIGRKVLQSACRQARVRQESYPNVVPRTLYVNLSVELRIVVVGGRRKADYFGKISGQTRY